MTDYKLVPVEPTWDMEEAGQYALEVGCHASGIYADMLADAPMVNIVTTKNEQGQIVSVSLQDEDHRILEVIAEADVQEESVASAPVAAQQRFRHPQKSTQGWSAWQPASINLDRPSWGIDSQGFEVEYRLLYDAPQPTEQQPAPDVEGLVEALEEISEPIRFMKQRLEEGERLDGVAAVQLYEDTSYLRGIARAALAAHRKGVEV